MSMFNWEIQEDVVHHLKNNQEGTAGKKQQVEVVRHNRLPVLEIWLLDTLVATYEEIDGTIEINVTAEVAKDWDTALSKAVINATFIAAKLDHRVVHHKGQVGYATKKDSAGKDKTFMPFEVSGNRNVMELVAMKPELEDKFGIEERNVIVC